MKLTDWSRRCFVCLFSLTALFLSLTPTRADSEVLEYNGHLYQHITSYQYWEQAQESCEVWNGHLVTIGSSGENEFVYDNFVAPGGLPWLGGTAQGGEGEWRWVTDEPWSYTNWCPWCPGDPAANANYLAIGDHTKDAWYPDTGGVRTFICEWDDETAERILSFAQFGTGEGLRFDLVLVNPASSVTATGTVRFWDPNGNQIDSSTFLPGGVEFALPPRGTRTFSTTGMGEVVTGSITVHANIPVAGVVRFFLPNAGLTGVGSSEPQGSVIVPVRRGERLSSGVAIRNAFKDWITVDLTLQDEEGQAVAGGTAVRQIPVNGRLSEFIEEYFPGADTDNFRGTILIEVRTTGHLIGQVDVIGLELEVGGGNPKFTTLPVKPVTHAKFLPDLTPRRPEGWSSKIVVSKNTGTSTDDPDLKPWDELYVDYAVLNHGKVAMNDRFQTDLLVDDVVFASDYSDPPLEQGGWVIWQDRPIGKLSSGTHSITVLVHGVPGSDYTDSVYTKFITLVADYSGTWSGTTEQERPLSFEVEEGRVTLVTLDVRVQGTNCTRTISGGVRVTPGATITSDSFVWSFSDPWGDSVTLSGTFTSASEVSGTLKASSLSCNGNVEVNWSAEKE